MQSALSVSQRRACTLIGQPRSTQRYAVGSPPADARLLLRIQTLKLKHPRYGYRRIWKALRAEGFNINRKKVHRLCKVRGK